MDHTIDYVNLGIAAFLLAIMCIKLFGDIHLRKASNKERLQFTKMLVANSIMLLAVILGKIFVCTIKNDMLLIFLSTVAYAVYFVGFYMLLGFYSVYVTYYISRMSGKKLKIRVFILLLVISYLVMLVFYLFRGGVISFDGNNFEKGPLYFIGQVGGYSLLFLTFIYMVVYRQYLKLNNILRLLSIVFFPLIGVIIRSFVPDLEVLPYSFCLSLIFMDNTFQYEQERLILEQEDKISRDRIKILLSQIRPHFLYNVLNSIYVLCEKDPEKAQEAIGRFADYLRGNLDSLEKAECITLQKEMDHVTNYLSLEKMRFREKLTIKYDIKDERFLLPALSVQLLVENAVKHGIHKKEEGGIVRVESFSDEDYYYVVVEDNGVGFDSEEIKNSDGLHIGLDNLRERLLTMCKGLLIIESTKGVGTKSTIKIPKVGYN
ncbi:sensor histidine kinase [Butyrivibrio sp. LC3010]|uniref:sensor histidine kinase n=1 Tax=Butyrivibrio sp. LC3010 TaxID=1280680 RepID=UPI0004275787|nr:histidine kinase [Butyrivibrio sp. LC3010]